MKNQDSLQVVIGTLIKRYRKQTRLNAREFAEKIRRPYADYVECELGCGFHLDNANFVIDLLDGLSEALTHEDGELIRKIKKLRETGTFLKFSDIFEREDLRPEYIYTGGKRVKATLEEQEQILDVVFKD